MKKYLKHLDLIGFAIMFFFAIDYWFLDIFFSSSTVIPGVFKAASNIEDLTCADPIFSECLWAKGALVPSIIKGRVVLFLG